MYRPSLGVWLSNDPEGFDGGQVNLYEFVGDNPVNETDPSGLAGVGHHWGPVGAIFNSEVLPYLSQAAIEVAMGAYSGPTTPPHNFRTFGGVTHHQYNQIVKKNLLDYIKANKIKKMTAEQMYDFILKVEAGQNYCGKAEKSLKKFNEAIRSEVVQWLNAEEGRKPLSPTTLETWRERGRIYLKNPRFFNTAIGAWLASAATGMLLETKGALEVAANSMNFRKGVQALANGDPVAAYGHFFDQGEGGFFGDLVDKGFNLAALNFKKYYDDAYQQAQTNLQKAMEIK